MSPLRSALASLLVVTAVVAAALLLNVLIHAHVGADVIAEHHEVAGWLTTLVGGAYGVVLAFLLGGAWQHYELARDGAMSEANAAADIHLLAEGLPEPVRSTLQREVVAYLDHVAADEWPLLARRRASDNTQARLHDIWLRLVRLDPRHPGVGNLQQSALERVACVGDERRRRLLVSRRHIPFMLWAVLVFGAAVTIGLTNFFALPYSASQMIMTSAVAAILAAVLVTIDALDRPYRGPLRIAPTELERIAAMLRAKSA